MFHFLVIQHFHFRLEYLRALLTLNVVGQHVQSQLITSNELLVANTTFEGMSSSLMLFQFRLNPKADITAVAFVSMLDIQVLLVLLLLFKR